MFKKTKWFIIINSILLVLGAGLLTFGLIGKFATVEVDYNYVDPNIGFTTGVTQYKGSIISFSSGPNIMKARAKVNNTWTEWVDYSWLKDSAKIVPSNCYSWVFAKDKKVVQYIATENQGTTLTPVNATYKINKSAKLMGAAASVGSLFFYAIIVYSGIYAITKFSKKKEPVKKTTKTTKKK